MNFYKLTSEEIEKLNAEKEKKELEFTTLQETTEVKLWENELNSFGVMYRKITGVRKPQTKKKFKKMKK